MKQKKSRGTFTRTRRICMAIMAVLMCTSCEVTRVITTTAESKVNDDKNIIIQTKTIESYMGSKNVKQQ